MPQNNNINQEQNNGSNLDHILEDFSENLTESELEELESLIDEESTPQPTLSIPHINNGVLQGIDPAGGTTWIIFDSSFQNPLIKNYIKDTQLKTFYDEILNEEVSHRGEPFKVIIGKNTYGATICPFKEGKAPITLNREKGVFEYIKSEDLAKELGYTEDVYQGLWFKSGEKINIRGKAEHFVYNNSSFFKEGTKEDQKKFGTYSQTFQLAESKQYTFGIEFEASTLWFPYYLAKDYNLNCMRDGSLNAGSGGPEVVTGVLHGDNGFRHLNEICNELSKRAKLDKYCSTHIHLGGMSFNKENLVYLYELCCYIEDEVFQLVPESRRFNDYCRRLKHFDFKHDIINQSREDYKINIDNDYGTLYDFIAVKQTAVKSRKNNHPMGAKCGYNHSTPRYSWVNFVPAMFNTRGSEESKSWEIRLHSATLNYNKTRNWLLIWMGVMWFVENCKLDIKKGIKLEDIMYKAYPKMGKMLVQYIEDRKLTFSQNSSDSAEYVVTTDKNKTITELCAL